MAEMTGLMGEGDGMAEPEGTDPRMRRADPGVHEAALASIYCRSGVPHPQPETFGPACATCVDLAELAVCALWDDAVDEGRRQAAREIIEADQVADDDTSGAWLAMALQIARRTGMTDQGTRIRGHCPACGGESLSVDGGRVTCRRLACTRPTAVDELLADRETEHVVELGPASFSVRHPLAERLDDEFMACALHEHLTAHSGPPYAPGRYRVVWRGDPHTALWRRLEGAGGD